MEHRRTSCVFGIAFYVYVELLEVSGLIVSVTITIFMVLCAGAETSAPGPWVQIPGGPEAPVS